MWEEASYAKSYFLQPFDRPYDGKWSKTMIGFGPEDDHFVLELTYNYGIKEYKLGNDFQVIYIIYRIIDFFYCLCPNCI